jgi:hypothetical protein
MLRWTFPRLCEAADSMEKQSSRRFCKSLSIKNTIYIIAQAADSLKSTVFFIYQVSSTSVLFT